MIEATIRFALMDSILVLSIDENIEALLGYKAEDFLNNRVSLKDRIHPHDHDITNRMFSPSIHNKSGPFNIRIRHANGRIRCIKGYYTKETGSNGQNILNLLLQDAKSLRQFAGYSSTMQNFKAMMENTDDYIYFKDRNHVFTGASHCLVVNTDPIEPSTDLLGLTDYDVFPEEYADIYYQLEKQVFAGTLVAHEVQQYLAKDGRKGWVRQPQISDQKRKWRDHRLIRHCSRYYRNQAS